MGTVCVCTQYLYLYIYGTCIGGDVFLFPCCIVKKKQQKMSGVRRAGKITKSGTGQVKELPLVVRAKGLWERLRRCVCQPCLSVCLSAVYAFVCLSVCVYLSILVQT